MLQGIIRPTREDLFYFERPDASNEFLPDVLPIWIDQTDLRIAYGFPDLGSGLKMGFHRLGPGFDPDLPSDATGSSAAAEAADYFKQRFSTLENIHLNKTQVCHYENTPNGDFLIDRHPGTENVSFIGGGSGHGFKHAPAAAEYVGKTLYGTEEREYRFSLATKQNALGGRVL